MLLRVHGFTFLLLETTASYQEIGKETDRRGPCNIVSMAHQLMVSGAMYWLVFAVGVIFEPG